MVASCGLGVWHHRLELETETERDILDHITRIALLPGDGAGPEVMAEAGLGAVPVASLAKENEEIYLRGRSAPIVLPRSSNGLKLLQRLRDEAHRFAIGYFQKVHRKRTFSSSLDAVSGIGPVRKKALLKQFGSVQGIREASLEELTGVKGVNRALALQLKEAL